MDANNVFATIARPTSLPNMAFYENVSCYSFNLYRMFFSYTIYKSDSLAV